jgi:PKD repeat protein
MKFTTFFTSKFNRLILLVLIGLMSGLQEARSQFCNSNFTYSINQTQGLIYFTPADMDSLSTHFWNLAGIGSTLRQPTRALFTAPGTYRIMHQISKAGCIPDSSEQFITISATCNANFNFTVNNANLQVTFISADTLPNTTHLWTFGTQGSSTLPALVKQFSTAGTYYITHIITRGSCSDTVSKWVTVGNTPCVANFTYTVDSLGVVHFTNTSTPTSANPPYPLIYQWSFGSVGSGSTQKNPSYYYVNNGWYKVCLRVTKPDTTCTDLFCDSIYRGPINTPTCIANFNFGVDSGNPKKIHFTNTSTYDTISQLPVQFIWSFGDGDSAIGSNQNHIYASGGSYQVCLTIKRGSCQNTNCKTVTVSTLASCKAGFTYTADSNGMVYFTNTSTPNDNPPFDTLTYAWNFGDNTASAQKNPSHYFATNGWYHVCLTVTKRDSSCTDVFCDTIYAGPINSPSCQANFNFTIDAGNPKKVHFVSTSTYDSLSRLPIQFIWSFGNGDSAIGYNPNYTYPTAGSYQVCLTIKQGNCQNTNCKTVTVLGPPSCNASFTYTLYPDSIDGTKRIVIFNNTSTGLGPIDSHWSFGDSTWLNSTTSPTHYYAVNGTYVVCLTIFGADSCQDDTCVTIAIVPDSTTGLKTLSGLERMKLYPVPMTNTLQVDLLPDTELPYEVTLSNALGMQVLHESKKAEQGSITLNVEALPQGMYYLIVSNKTGSVVKRLMK